MVGAKRAKEAAIKTWWAPKEQLKNWPLAGHFEEANDA